MKLKIAYTFSFLLIALSGILLFFFFAFSNEGQPQLSDKCFLSGFLSLCISFILLPLEPNYLANRKGFRVRYYNFLTK